MNARALLIAIACAAGSAAAAPVPLTTTPSWILVEQQSGRVLAEQEADLRRPPASLTKIMTGFVVFDAIERGELTLDDRARVSRKAWSAGHAGSRSFVRQGSAVKVKDLLRGMTVVSGNDAAMALAERVGGSEDGFVARMNAASRNLNLTNTQWANPTGLHDPGQLTTARDLAELTRALLLRHPNGYAYYGGYAFEWDGVKQHSSNVLLAQGKRKDGSPRGYPGADGVKTGFTRDAGYCIVGSAVRDGRRLIVVLLGAESPRARARDARALLDWGFAETSDTMPAPLLDSSAPAPAR